MIGVTDRTIEKQMGITHAEFYRLIDIALGGVPHERVANGIWWEADGKRGQITLGPQALRQIALLAVPTTPVTIELTGYDDASVTAFLDRFDRAYQRGGG